ncbi:GreA/GreB family elongation factor [Nocardioides sp. cx-173]|uniref:GreA/GreB family elongation factor n=1 Tax=Nocardioides sp. cx-173 TaxID=2898796 RepID=UPI001E65AE22|nr:GreA/GreB family elongation factor [Nocardioides sp. cx-173]MCD4525577.1 GreA/GreB family elongation factor [Nocardioides sp. cx-173]UGB42721.1 GreA/GreB family elongation factor [Nocardioides sp. cx-173]
MTTTTATASTEILTDRLAALREERDQVRAESLIVATGDAADRATNVEATIRLQLLDERIAAVEKEIEESRRRRPTDGVVSVGDVVTLDLGDGPEKYLIGSVETASAGVDVVTPSSPLGRAIVGTRVGETVTYKPRGSVTLEAKVLGV